MNFELRSARRSTHVLQYYDESDKARKASRRETIYNDDLIGNMVKLDEMLKQGFGSFISSPNRRLCILGIFTCIAMTIGILTVYFTTRQSAPACQLTFQRTMKSSIVSSPQSRSVAVGDLNNDDQIDIVVANSGTNIIGIFLSNGDGTFANQQTYSTGSQSHPYSVIVSNFNNDNYLDIAVANYGINNIGIFLGIGNGTFAEQKLFSLGSSRPLFITIGDFNKDNRTDLAVVNYGTNNIGILLGYGNGSFQNQVTYSTGYDSIPYSLAVGDFNNDNQLDIAAVNHGTSNVGIFIGYGNGAFASQQTYTTNPNSNPTSIALGDFNNDNQLDIIVANNGTGNIGIFFGQGDGSFLPQIIYSIGSNVYPQYITAGDLNKDNELDIVIVDSINNEIYIIPGYGNGNFTTITTYDAISGSNPYWTTLADFNNNNQTDIVVANYGTSNLLVLIDYFQNPSARQKNYDVGTPSFTAGVAVSDFNNDHILDILSYTNEDLIILIGLGNGIFPNVPTFSIPIEANIQYICVGDLNNDNQTDIVITNIVNNTIGVFLGYGNGTFTPMTTYSTGIDSNPYWVALGDVNNDKRMDIISANQGSGTIGIFVGNDDGTFTTMMTYSTGIDSLPTTLAVGDINNDNYLDIVVGTFYDGVIILIGDGNASFIFWGTYSTTKNAGTYSIVLTDLNSDTYLDIVIANIYTNNIGVFLGYGNGSFTTQITYSTGYGSQPCIVIAADFNNDNMSGIVVTYENSDQVVILYAYGNGSLVPTRTYSTGDGSSPTGVIAADLDNNNQLEIVVALWGTGDIAVLTAYDAAEFVDQTKYSTGSAPQSYSVAVGDFNNDNRSDIVVANSGNGTLSILFGSNNGTFDTEMIYPIGIDSDPQFVMTCHINNDNYLDIVSVNSKKNSISIIMGYGNGSFAEQVIYSTGDNSLPFSVASGDFNNDTWLDLVVTNTVTDSIGIFFGFDYSSFQSQVPYENIYSLSPLGIVVSDFNNDNYLDLAATFSAIDVLGIILGYGDGTFNITFAYSTEPCSTPAGIAVGDFNNDNQTDIVVTCETSNTIVLFLGYGNGTFDFGMTYSTGNNSYPMAVAVGDFNNDSQIDIVVANYNASNVGILLGYGNGSFSMMQTYFSGQNSYPSSVTVGDFNNDGRLDIAVVNYGTNNVGILVGYGDGTFENQITFSTGDNSSPDWVIVGHFNSDNQLDIAVANWVSGSVGILLGYGNVTFADVVTYSTGSGSLVSCIGVGDFNNDNISDIAVTDLGTNNIAILFGIGDGSFLLGITYSTGNGSQPFALATGDFNNDTRLDVAVANSQGNNIGIFLGYGSVPFGSITTNSTGDGSQPHSVTVGDLNNDGWLDIITANYGNDNIGVLLGHSNGALQSMITYPTGNGSAPYSLALAHFNNDHHLDIVVSNSETDNIAIFLGYGDGRFANGVLYSTGAHSRPYTVAIGDFNNDNISDIAVANSGISNIFLFYGYGNGTFGNDTFYSLGYEYYPYSVAVGDLNQNNWMDIVIACYGTNHIETLIKMC